MLYDDKSTHKALCPFGFYHPLGTESQVCVDIHPQASPYNEEAIDRHSHYHAEGTETPGNEGINYGYRMRWWQRQVLDLLTFNTASWSTRF